MTHRGRFVSEDHCSYAYNMNYALRGHYRRAALKGEKTCLICSVYDNGTLQSQSVAIPDK